MAMQTISQAGKIESLTEILDVGDSLEGHLVGYKDSPKFEGQKLLLIVDGEGNRRTFGAVGNIKYLIEDGLMTVGALTRFTRTDDVKVKGGKKASRFEVAQDLENTVAVEPVITSNAAPASTAVTSAGMAAKVAALKGQTAAS